MTLKTPSITFGFFAGKWKSKMEKKYIKQRGSQGWNELKQDLLEAFSRQEESYTIEEKFQFLGELYHASIQIKPSLDCEGSILNRHE